VAEDKKADQSDDGTFVGQIRQNGYCRQIAVDEYSRTQQRFTVPCYEQWDGAKWITITKGD
jgi:hypothetical protein